MNFNEYFNQNDIKLGDTFYYENKFGCISIISYVGVNKYGEYIFEKVLDIYSVTDLRRSTMFIRFAGLRTYHLKKLKNIICSSDE